MIPRDLKDVLVRAAAGFPVVTVVGPRQSGKSTLCRSAFPEHAYVTLEAPDTRAFATTDPRAFLTQFRDGVVIDEFQRAPEIASYLQGFVDEDARPGRWVLTGSQNLSVSQTVSQSLAGRTALLELLPLSRPEMRRFDVYPRTLDEVVLSGGYPRILDARLIPSDWVRAYVATYLERDVRSLSNVGDLATFQRFLALCAGRTAQLLNVASLATDCGISSPTAAKWLAVLEASYIAFRLPAYHANVSKRLTKAAKLHFYDTGVACWLLGITTVEHLRTHPLRGALIETWVVSEILKHRTNRGLPRGLFHYRDRHGTEADLIVERDGNPTIVEAKSSATPDEALADAARRVARALGVDAPQRVIVAYGGDERQARTDFTLIPWEQLDAEDWA